jgi:hypothetical protein
MSRSRSIWPSFPLAFFFFSDNDDDPAWPFVVGLVFYAAHSRRLDARGLDAAVAATLYPFALSPQLESRCRCCWLGGARRRVG